MQIYAKLINKRSLNAKTVLPTPYSRACARSCMFLRGGTTKQSPVKSAEIAALRSQRQINVIFSFRIARFQNQV